MQWLQQNGWRWEEVHWKEPRLNKINFSEISKSGSKVKKKETKRNWLNEMLKEKNSILKGKQSNGIGWHEVQGYGPDLEELILIKIAKFNSL